MKLIKKWLFLLNSNNTLTLLSYKMYNKKYALESMWLLTRDVLQKVSFERKVQEQTCPVYMYYPFKATFKILN